MKLWEFIFILGFMTFVALLVAGSYYPPNQEVIGSNDIIKIK